MYVYTHKTYPHSLTRSANTPKYNIHTDASKYTNDRNQQISTSITLVELQDSRAPTVTYGSRGEDCQRQDLMEPSVMACARCHRLKEPEGQTDPSVRLYIQP